MSMPASPSQSPLGQGSAGSTDVVTTLQGITRQLSNGNTLLQTLITSIGTLTTAIQSVLPRIFGSFTLNAAASTTVLQAGIKANAMVKWTPTNAAAATLEGSAKALYLASISPGVSFTVATASGGNAAGTETFQYSVENPA